MSLLIDEYIQLYYNKLFRHKNIYVNKANDCCIYAFGLLWKASFDKEWCYNCGIFENTHSYHCDLCFLAGITNDLNNFINNLKSAIF